MNIKKIVEEDIPGISTGKSVKFFNPIKLVCQASHLASNLGVVELTMAMHLVQKICQRIKIYMGCRASVLYHTIIDKGGEMVLMRLRRYGRH